MFQTRFQHHRSPWPGDDHIEIITLERKRFGDDRKRSVTMVIEHVLAF